MIKGIGIDICKISRIKLTLAKKILSEEEMIVYQSLKLEKRKREYLAGRFSVKEAIYKALSVLYPHLGMTDVTVLNDASGKPFVKVPKINHHQIHISISHEIDYVVAQAIFEEV